MRQLFTFTRLLKCFFLLNIDTDDPNLWIEWKAYKKRSRRLDYNKQQERNKKCISTPLTDQSCKASSLPVLIYL